MKPRATKTLAPLRDEDLFRRLAEGMGLLAEHARKLESAVRHLQRSKHVRGAFPLRALAEEEAAKFLILLDTVRCPRQPQHLRADQLARFHNHLAKGLYIETYGISPADYAEVRSYVDMLRRSHYLDGPTAII